MQKFSTNILLIKTWYLQLLGFLFCVLNTGYSQNIQAKGDKYLIGEEEKLEMIVHIWGEVRNPGEYRVQDDTNVLELISKAGGPTEFSNLEDVILTRGGFPWRQLANFKSNATLQAKKDNLPEYSKGFQKRVIRINLKEYLEKEDFKGFPKLQPGDVLRIKRNSWFRWMTAIRLVSQIAIVFQAMYYFSQIND